MKILILFVSFNGLLVKSFTLIHLVLDFCTCVVDKVHKAVKLCVYNFIRHFVRLCLPKCVKHFGSLSNEHLFNGCQNSRLWNNGLVLLTTIFHICHIWETGREKNNKQKWVWAEEILVSDSSFCRGLKKRHMFVDRILAQIVFYYSDGIRQIFLIRKSSGFFFRTEDLWYFSFELVY